MSYSQERYDDSHDDGYVSFEIWMPSYIYGGQKKESSCCIRIEPFRVLNGVSSFDKTRLSSIEDIVKCLGFVEVENYDVEHDDRPLVFESHANLNVPYEESDVVKELGAYWNHSKKVWFVPAGRDIRPFEKWSPKVDDKFVARLSVDDDAYLSTTFLEKDEVKNLGACWDADKKKWFVPPGVTLRPFLKWNPVVNGWPISTRTRTFVGGAVDLASVKAQLRRLQFRDVYWK